MTNSPFPHHFIDSVNHRKLSCYPVNLTGPNPQNNQSNRVIAVVPARLGSTRLPGKALLPIAGKPMICWVAERATAARNVDRVIVATDDQKILEVAQSYGFESVITSTFHKSGTDRIAEVAAQLPDCEIVVNVQGDEPLISPETIENAVSAIEHEMLLPDGASIVTCWEPIDFPADVFNPDLVKIVLDERDYAMCFSRSAVPFPRDAVNRHSSLTNALDAEPELLMLFRKHTDLYVYRKDVLLQFTNWQQTKLEQLEGLEQLRAMEHGVRIKAIQASTRSTGVDTNEDFEKVRSLVEDSQAGNLCLA
ncbi:MAG TPA: 3-deoxy-manno-octulosonate cytidylyltransferase [Pyrinomonadaceae bacterium]|nr:3-deoxy-manno-octulosonate cytidylyltransferase [Pyrinomonadaceae bacterium]